MKTEVETLRVFNPFSGKNEKLICTIKITFFKKDLFYANITKVVSEQGDDILEWLNNDKVEEMENGFMEEWK